MTLAELEQHGVVMTRAQIEFLGWLSCSRQHAAIKNRSGNYWKIIRRVKGLSTGPVVTMHYWHKKTVSWMPSDLFVQPMLMGVAIAVDRRHIDGSYQAVAVR